MKASEFKVVAEARRAAKVLLAYYRQMMEQKLANEAKEPAPPKEERP